MVSDITEVPKYKNNAVVRHEKKFVSVGVRSYIQGQTLSSVMTSLSQDDIDAIVLQVAAIVWCIARKCSQYFGHVQDGALRCTTATGYVNAKIFTDKLAGILHKDDCLQLGKGSTYVGNAVLCHRNLSPDHIIVNGAVVVGISGLKQYKTSRDPRHTSQASQKEH